jgi:hypothetical protein
LEKRPYVETVDSKMTVCWSRVWLDVTRKEQEKGKEKRTRLVG